MPKHCIVTGRKSVAGRKYVYRGIAKKKKGIGLKVTGISKRRFLPNIKKKRMWLDDEKRFVTLKLSTAAMRTISKKGITAVIREVKKQGKSI
ncbi:MAG: 50S ribosomal protein L28 [Chlamydiae bacterium]|nr:50S ribosomal protein L28 [Chlamydiota bacterium]